jgi:tRNA pseudouridine32 synthase/23S rRNA pseudouridine746 synthase
MFENEHFFAVDKRPGYLTVPSRFKEKDSRPCEMTEWMSEKKIRLWAIHRLDEEVSGILLFAKSAQAHQVANTWFEKRIIQKTYQALSRPVSHLEKPSGKLVWKSRLLRGKKRAYEREFGKEAITEAEFLKNTEINGREFSLWNLFPLTGRSHQLRFEMAKHGFVILGDTLYGAKEELNNRQSIALRAIELNLSHCPERELFQLPKCLKTSELINWINWEGGM